VTCDENYEYEEVDGASVSIFGSYGSSSHVSSDTPKNPHGSIGEPMGFFFLSEAELGVVLAVASDTTIDTKWVDIGQQAADEMKELSASKHSGTKVITSILSAGGTPVAAARVAARTASSSAVGQGKTQEESFHAAAIAAGQAISVAHQEGLVASNFEAELAGQVAALAAFEAGASVEQAAAAATLAVGAEEVMDGNSPSVAPTQTPSTPSPTQASTDEPTVTKHTQTSKAVVTPAPSSAPLASSLDKAAAQTTIFKTLVPTANPTVAAKGAEKTAGKGDWSEALARSSKTVVPTPSPSKADQHKKGKKLLKPLIDYESAQADGYYYYYEADEAEVAEAVEAVDGKEEVAGAAEVALVQARTPLSHLPEEVHYTHTKGDWAEALARSDQHSPGNPGSVGSAVESPDTAAANPMVQWLQALSREQALGGEGRGEGTVSDTELKEREEVAVGEKEVGQSESIALVGAGSVAALMAVLALALVISNRQRRLSFGSGPIASFSTMARTMTAAVGSTVGTMPTPANAGFVHSGEQLAVPVPDFSTPQRCSPEMNGRAEQRQGTGVLLTWHTVSLV
jgi:hypothetical protein